MVLMKYMRANRTAPLFMLLWQSAFFALGVAIVLITNAFVADETECMYIGSMMALLATVFGPLIRGNLTGHVRFRLAISMGETRLSSLLCTPVITAGISLLGVLTAWLMSLAEKALYAVVYPGCEVLLSLEKVFSPVVILCVVAGTVLLELVLSALMQRFGNKGLLVIWGAYCVLVLLFPRMIDAYRSGSTSILAKIGGAIITAITTIPAKGWIAIGAVFVLALLVFVVDTFRKAEVKL